MINQMRKASTWIDLCFISNLSSLSFPPSCSGQMNIDSCSCVLCYGVRWNLWRKHESQWGRRKKIQQNIATDFNLFLNFRFFPLILIWNLNILINFFHFTAALYFYSDSSKKGNGRRNPQITQLCVLLLKNFSCLWELSLFYFFNLLLTTTKENLFFHLDYRSLHWLSIIHMSGRKWGVEDSALIWE